MKQLIYHGQPLYMTDHFAERVRERKIDLGLVERILTRGVIEHTGGFSYRVSMKVDRGEKMFIVIGMDTGVPMLITSYYDRYDAAKAA